MSTDIAKAQNNWIYQSNKLIEASYSFTVLEQKLIRLLASMIKKDDEEFKEYKFKATELCTLLDIKPNNVYKELDQITDKMMSRHIKFKNEGKENFKKRHLVKIADFEKGELTLKIDEDMKDFYLKLNWYTKYQLKNVMKFKSTYSFRLYELLKQYEAIGSRTITIEELRFILDIDKDQYPKYANLKQKVITVAIKEINKNTDLFIKSDDLKEVRKVSAIKFVIKSNNENEISATYTAADKDSAGVVLKIQEILNTKLGADVSLKSAKEIFDNAKLHKRYKDPIKLIEEVAEYSKTQKIKKGVVGWLKVTVKNFERPVQVALIDNFNNFEQRNYDYDDLEKRLLGWDKEPVSK